MTTSDKFLRSIFFLMSLDRNMLGQKQIDLNIKSMFRGQLHKFSQNAERIPLFIGLQQKYLPFSIVFVYRVILCDNSLAL